MRFTIAAAALLLLLGTTACPTVFPQGLQSPLIRSPYSLDFGRVVTGTESDSQTVTVFNNGTAAQEVNDISITGDFTETNNCPKPPSALAINADCEIQATFSPLTLAPFWGTLTISEAPSGVQLTVALGGTGTAAKPTVTVSPRALAFPELQTGVHSPAQTVTVTNTGTEMVSVLNVVATGDFMVMPASTCTHMVGQLGPNATCTIEIAFAPLLTGPRSGKAVVVDNARESPQQVPLSGIGK